MNPLNITICRRETRFFIACFEHLMERLSIPI